MDITNLRKNHLQKSPILATVSGVASTKKELIELFDKKIPSIDIITTKSFIRCISLSHIVSLIGQLSMPESVLS